MTWTIYGAALLNLAICAGVLKLAKNRAQREEPSGDKRKTKSKKHKQQKKNQQKGQQQGQNQQTQKQRAEEAATEFRLAVAKAVMAGIGLSGVAAMIFRSPGQG
jgi:mannitol-specific phosphotransferase system IIBC component